MKNFPITQHFDFFQLTDSRQFPGLVQANREYFWQRPALLINGFQCCFYFLQPIRDYLNEPVYVTSGARFPELNIAAKGSIYSQHEDMAATDFTNQKFMYDILLCVDRGKHHVIDFMVFCIGIKAWHEFRIYPKRGFCHISLPTGVNDMQVEVIE